MSTSTKRDVTPAALSVADDAAQGRLSPTDLQQQAVAELRELVGSVVGDGDPLWELQCDVARQAVGLGALSPDELRKWAAVLDRKRGVEPVEAPESQDDPIPMVSSASVDESPDSDGSDDDDPDAEPDAAALQGVSVAAALAELASRAAAQRAARETAEAKAEPQGSADGYDPLAGWNAGGSRRV
ncbi:hypothetical protein A4G26_22230 [Mycobacterium kansasii]|uniref:Flagellar hook-length control protein n=1 Tax=Mycobacterium innocens TaxID=2341083 RepID=A0A498QBZ9_9MYCO|nr:MULTISPECIES: hypothetical protein [Mycobacterium]KZS75908.1 hypothetical protein A4G26_22230 [Mycobacterium kansasii]VBA43066.1 hypothetical protein LAUMK13_04344 [Mycobacterium innocens]